MTFIPQQSFMIGPYSSGSSGMANLEVDGSGDYAPPHSNYKPYSKMITSGDGLVMGMGWATGEWYWDVMTRTQRDWLRTYIPGASADLWIKTKTMDSSDSYQVFHAVGVWPIESEDRDATRRMKFSIKFQRIVTS